MKSKDLGQDQEGSTQEPKPEGESPLSTAGITWEYRQTPYAPPGQVIVWEDQASRRIMVMASQSLTQDQQMQAVSDFFKARQEKQDASHSAQNPSGDTKT